MKKSENYTVFGTIAVLVSTLAISLTYSGFTQQLNIVGSAQVMSSKWDVHFANLNQITSGTTVVNTPAQIKTGSTSIGDYSVSFYSPGDSLTYTFDVVNEGNFPAKLSGLTVGTPSCRTLITGSTNTNTANVCNNLSYELFDATTNVKLTVADEENLAANGGVRHLRLVLTYKVTNNDDYLAVADVEVTGLGVTLIYSQNGYYDFGN